MTPMNFFVWLVVMINHKRPWVVYPSSCTSSFVNSIHNGHTWSKSSPSSLGPFNCVREKIPFPRALLDYDYFDNICLLLNVFVVQVVVSTHAIRDISYCSKDIEDKRVFGYVTKDRSGNYCHVFMASNTVRPSTTHTSTQLHQHTHMYMHMCALAHTCTYTQSHQHAHSRVHTHALQLYSCVSYSQEVSDEIVMTIGQAAEIAYQKVMCSRKLPYDHVDADPPSSRWGVWPCLTLTSQNSFVFSFDLLCVF